MFVLLQRYFSLLQVPRLVKVMQEESPYFKVISPPNVGHKVGPGLPTTFKIQFTPDEKKVKIKIILIILGNRSATFKNKMSMDLQRLGLVTIWSAINSECSPMKKWTHTTPICTIYQPNSRFSGPLTLAYISYIYHISEWTIMGEPCGQSAKGGHILVHLLHIFQDNCIS